MLTLKIYTAYFLQFLKQRLAYKGDFFASILANITATLAGLLFILFLLDGKVVQGLKGWSREEVLFIYGYSMIAMALFSTFATNLYQFGDRYVIQGQFDRVLLRPLGTLGQVLFESFNLQSIGSLAVGVLVILYTGERLDLTFGVLDYLWLFVSCASGATILLSIFIFLASLSFHFEDRIGIAPPFYNLIAFGRYPLPVFNHTLQFILRWVVPFAFVAFYPATHFMDRSGFEFFCYLTPVIAVICFGVACVGWRFGVSRYTSTGS
ncbi:ABC-2 family transporter protein [Oligoflexia bacterium]|nr:ABC-2 family transporter protein [Oligoflexia bacterium]